MLVKELIQHLTDHHNPEDTVAWDVWCREDVIRHSEH
jgi:hypothetical protein